MIRTQKPYFMKNEEWYRYNPKTFTYELTEKAPEKARQSHKEYYEFLKSNVKEIDK